MSLVGMLSRSPASDWTRNHGFRNICAARKATQLRRSVSLNGTISKSLRYQTRGTSGNSIVPERVWTIVSVY